MNGVPLHWLRVAERGASDSISKPVGSEPVTSLERDVGALEARMQTVEQEIQAMRDDVREIRDTLVTARGGWRTLTIVIGMSLSLGAVIAKFLPMFNGPKC